MMYLKENIITGSIATSTAMPITFSDVQSASAPTDTEIVTDIAPTGHDDDATDCLC